MSTRNQPWYRSTWTRALLYLVAACAWIGLATNHAQAQTTSSANAGSTTASQPFAIPPGTILPMVLRTTITPKDAKQGETVRGEIAQDVPLPGGSRIHKGSRVEGHVVDVAPAANAAGTQISIRFDKLYSHGQAIPITTDLRAMAGFMDVLEAKTPLIGMGEGDVSEWMPTAQIGGDSVYGASGGTVETPDNEVVGKSLLSGGVLVAAHPNGKCRGEVSGNSNPQPLWVFSSNACGTYGLSQVNISHAGRTNPVGTFTLQVQHPNTKLRDGDALLLRVIS
jgi:hypothetical protein